MHAPEQISLRPAVPADLPAMLSLFRAAILTAGTADYSPKQLAAWASSADDVPRWEGYLRDLDVIVAVVDGCIAGFGALKAPAHIELMYVHPDYHRRGVAGKLMEALLAKTEGPVTAHVSKTARPFFERQGFIVVEALFPERQGIVISNYSMRRANW
ncbi:GNAT family N-acetyltransferase [Chitinophaga deserti]|uniref:GNAT family N-acetyltransferase n=1 Tax=Chitinophaga deserti TaxID=2164099 RepID=UPI000D6D1472|nr:GNAT family N-acetyltransferase [Chitinophaga deserti]